MTGAGIKVDRQATSLSWFHLAASEKSTLDERLKNLVITFDRTKAMQ